MQSIQIDDNITLHHNKLSQTQLYYCTSINNNINSINPINIMLSKTTEDNIDKVIEMIKNKKDTKNVPYNIVDKYYIFSDSKQTKWDIDNDKLYKNYKKNYKPSQYNNIIPANLRLSENALYKMILNEITKINTNMSYPHYVVVNNDNIYDLSLRIVYKESKVEYFEINLMLSSSYPFIPPVVEYSKPKITVELLSSILNMDIWNINTWNYTIPLEWLICNLATTLEPYFIKNLQDDDKYNILDMKIMELHSLVCSNTCYNIQLPVVKNIKNKDASYWKSGTGYGHTDTEEWNISHYIDNNMIKNEKICNILNHIITHMDSMCNNILNNIIVKQFEEINLMIFNKETKKYMLYLQILNKLLPHMDIEMISDIVKNTINIVKDINNIITNESLLRTLKDDDIPAYLYFIDVINSCNSVVGTINKKTENVCESQINDNNKEEYIKMVEEYNYDTMELDKKHRYYANNKINIKPNTIVRLMSEFSTIQQALPKSWDSSILFRIIPSNMNMCSFMIVGPKDTPYHNGLFEFHAYFPDDYPKTVPQVLLHTTGNDTVRFNPNLYANGKVCLSLLGTWSGQAGESWMPDISTFIQVIISIQSLILVDEPYFNEPGYEREIGTDRGKKNSIDYNDNIRYETVRLGMIDMIKNKPPEYEDFITEHFRLKKEELLMTVSKWVDESKNRDRFNKLYDELKILL